MPTIALISGVVLALGGAGLAVVERRVLQVAGSNALGPEVDAKLRAFLRERAARRLRIGFLIGCLGVAMVAGEAFEPRMHPLIWIGSWTTAAIIALVLVRLATTDYIASRRYWGGELHRSATEIAKTQAELMRRIGPDDE